MDKEKKRSPGRPKKKIYSSNEVIQGYIFTTARRNVGRFGEYLLTYLVRCVQAQFGGIDFQDTRSMKQMKPDFDKADIELDKAGNAYVNVPLKELFPNENYSNYTFVRRQVERLQKEIIRWEEGEYWYQCQIIGLTMGRISSNGRDISIVRCKIDSKIWNAILNCTKGFSVYDFEIQKKLKKLSSVRLYQIFYRNPVTLTLSIDTIKEIFGVEDKYKNTYNLIKKLIEPAKKELDSKSPYSFTYEVLIRDAETGTLRKKKDDGSDARKTIEAIRFTGTHILANDDNITNSVESYANPRLYIKDSTYRYLHDVLLFENYEINSCRTIFYNAELLMDAQNNTPTESKPHLEQFLRTIRQNAIQKIDPPNINEMHKYVIKAIKNHLEEMYDFKYRPSRKKPEIADKAEAKQAYNQHINKIKK